MSHNNLIEYNHCHDYGRNWLADMGGVYLLGVAPGTVVRNNLIHDAMSPTYGGWGVYLDEGSAHVVVENNVCHSFSSQAFHCHYGRENTLRNNIFAFGREAQIALSRGEPHRSLTIERNIIVSDGRPMYVGGGGCKVDAGHFRADLNLFWDVRGQVLMSAVKRDTNAKPVESADMEAWRASSGNDTHSIVADPLFTDIRHFDFTLTADSPAVRQLGFSLIDLSHIGPRAVNERE